MYYAERAKKHKIVMKFGSGFKLIHSTDAIKLETLSCISSRLIRDQKANLLSPPN